MASLKDRVNKEVTPTESTVLGIAGKTKGSKDKYPVNVVFDAELEPLIRERAKEVGLGVATYIKMLVKQDLNRG